MHFFIDQDVYQLTIEFLRSLGHDLLLASDVEMSRALDPEILATASQEERILVTRDKGFGSLVFAESLPRTGVILLRITPRTVDAVHAELARLLSEHTEDGLRRSFVVVEPDRHRIRPLNL